MLVGGYAAWGQGLTGSTGDVSAWGGLSFPGTQPFAGPLGSILTPVQPSLQAPAVGSATTPGLNPVPSADGGFLGLSPVAAGFVSGAFSGLSPAAGGLDTWQPTGGSWLGAPAAPVDAGWATAGQLFASPWMTAGALPEASVAGWTAIAPAQPLVPNATGAAAQAGLLPNSQPLQVQSPGPLSAPATEWGGTWLSPPSPFGGSVTPAWAPAQAPGANPWVQALPSAALSPNPWSATSLGGLNVAPPQTPVGSAQPVVSNPWAPSAAQPGGFIPASSPEATATSSPTAPPAAGNPWTSMWVTPGSFGPAPATMETTPSEAATTQPAVANPWSASFAPPAVQTPSQGPATTSLSPTVASPWTPAPTAPGSLTPNSLATGPGSATGQGTPTTPAISSPWVTPWTPAAGTSPQVQTGGSWLSNTVAPQTAAPATPAPNPFLPAAKKLLPPNYTPYSPFTGQPAAEPPAGR